MNKKDKEFIKEWFKSDLDIQIKFKYGKHKGIITLESNASYDGAGTRYGGNLRCIVWDSETFNDNYNLIPLDCFDYEELIKQLEALEINGFKLKVL